LRTTPRRCDEKSGLKRILKPIAAAAGKQLRHSTLEMTGWYMREIPDSVRSAVAKMDAEIMAKPVEKPGPQGDRVQ
jgi:hypothetical protein